MHARSDQHLRPEVFIDALHHVQARIAGDVLEVGPHTWAIHGSIPVDGEVLLVERERREDAEALLHRLSGDDQGGWR